jgi:hypothetical protein
MIPKRGVVMAALLIFAAFDVALPTQDQPSREQVAAPVMQGWEHYENFCADARIQAPATMLPQERLDEVIDGNLTTGLAVSLLQDDLLEIIPSGVPPWINNILIISQGEIDFELYVKDIYREEKAVAFTTNTVDRTDGLFETTLSFEGMRVTSILVGVAQEPGAPAGYGTILEVGATYDMMDPDDLAMPTIVTEWVEKYKGTPCGGNNSYQSAKSARGLAMALVNYLGWTWFWDWGNSLAWEQDFTNEGNYYDIDQFDMAFFKGHGGPGRFAFSHRYNDCRVWNTECIGEWGDENLEWVALSSCKVLHSSEWSNWHRCFNGLHLICGMHTNIRSAALGHTFGYEMAKKKRTIKQSWFKAVKKLSRPWWWWFAKKRWVTPVVLAEVWDNYNDHAWRAGYVSPDPVYDRWYWANWYTFLGVKSDEPSPSFDRSSATTIAFPERENPAFLVPEAVLAASPEDNLPLLNVTPRSVDTLYVRAIADDLCSYYGFLCGGDVEYEDTAGVYSLIDGAHELYVDEQSGAFEYTNSASYAVPVETAPVLLSEGDAADSTSTLLSSIGYMPIEYDPYPASWLREAMFDSETGEEVEDSSWNLNISNGYARLHSGYPVAGPGASIQVEFGDGGELQSLDMSGWRDVSEGTSVSTISLEQALEDVAYSGPDICIGGMPLCDTFLVDTSYIGYYEAPGDTIVDELSIVWIVDGYCVLNEFADTSEYELIIPARYRHPRGEIIRPSRDTTILPGALVTLEGSATLGTPPYQYTWYSDIDGALGTGSTIQVSLSVSLDTATSHTITLEVTDANMARDYAYVEVVVGKGKPIPTLTEWGMIIFSLMLLAYMMVAVMRRRAVVAGAGGGAHFSASTSGPVFVPAVFRRVLAATLTLAVAGLAAAFLISGSVALQDLFGTLVSAVVIAYVVHLVIACKKEE